MEEKTVFLVEWNEKAAIHKRPPKGLLASLYELPNTEGHLTADEAVWQVKKWICDKMQTGPEDQGGYAAIMAHMKALQVVAEPIGVAKHVFSHVQWDMVGYRVKILCENNGNTEELLENISENEHFFMVDKTALKEEYSVPSAFGAYIRLLG